MAARRVQFPQAPQDAPPNADRGDRQDAQQQADGQDVPRGDGNAQRVGQADGQNLPAPNVQAPPAQQPGPVQNADAQGGELELNIVFICFCLHLRGFAGARCQGLLCPELWARFRRGFCGMKALSQICELLVIKFIVP